MTDCQDSFQYDPQWPPKGKQKSLHVFTRKEDALIVDYLIKTNQYDRLGGNEVWKTMARSRKVRFVDMMWRLLEHLTFKWRDMFNPGGRSFQGLRERFLKHIIRHLHQYERVTPQIKGRFLKQNPKALKDINSMKSTKQLKRDLEATWSSEGEEEAVGENVPNQPSMTPVLLERKQLLSRIGLQKTLTSTPFQEVPEQVPPRVGEPQDVPEEGTNATPATEEQRDSSHLFCSGSVGNSHEEAPQDEPDVWKLQLLSEICTSLLFECDPACDFSFSGSESANRARRVSYTLQKLQNSLRYTIEAHSQKLAVKSFACVKHSCAGTSTYFGLWEELTNYFKKIERHRLQFDGLYLRFFSRVIKEILETPLCCANPTSTLPEFTLEELYEYLFCDHAKRFRNNLKSVQKLIGFVRSAN